MLPVLFALFLQSMYGAVDLLVCGHFASSVDVSGVSTGSQIMQTVTNFITSLAMGITVLLGQQLGSGRTEETKKTVENGIRFFMLLGLVLSIVFIFGAKGVAIIMNAPEEAMDVTTDYLRICGAGSVVIVAYNLLGSIFRGIGDSKTPLITVFIACVFNIAGDLFFVAVLDMGGAGAAIATVFAQLFSVLISLWIIGKQDLSFGLELRTLKIEGSVVKHILKIGIPIALQDFLVSLSFLIVLSLINQSGVSPPPV